MNNREYKYFAFISYSSKDEKWAKKLQDSLEHYKMPTNLNGKKKLPKKIRPIFRDITNLKTGNLSKQIEEALNNSKFLIVVCSPNSAQSEWVNKEVELFKLAGKTANIILYIVDGTPFAKESTQECYPKGIRTLPKEQELLGADINKLGRNDAIIKIVAQMFELSFDTLKQRYEREQKIKRWIFATSIILFSIVCFCIGLIFRNQNITIQGQYKIMSSQMEKIKNDSIALSAKNDSIVKQNELISQQKDELIQSNINLKTERDKVLKANWQILKSQSKLISEKCQKLIEKGDITTAIRLALFALPKNLNNPNRPYTSEAELILRMTSKSMGVPLYLLHHDSFVCSASFSNDGKYIVTASNDNTAKIWPVRVV